MKSSQKCFSLTTISVDFYISFRNVISFQNESEKFEVISNMTNFKIFSNLCDSSSLFWTVQNEDLITFFSYFHFLMISLAQVLLHCWIDYIQNNCIYCYLYSLSTIKLFESSKRIQTVLHEIKGHLKFDLHLAE